MEVNAILLGVRLVIHLATFVIIFCYTPKEGAKRKLSASVTAWLLAGSSGAAAMQILTNWDSLMLGEPMPWLPILCAAVLWKLWKAKGNVANAFKEEPNHG